MPVFLDPLENLPGDFDQLGARFDNAALLHEAGVRIAFSQSDGFHLRKIRQLAGNAVAHGLPWEAATRGHHVGPGGDLRRRRLARSHRDGQAADLVLWSGDPLEVTTVAENVWIAGRPVAMRSRQTELRDRYLERVKAHSAR